MRKRAARGATLVETMISLSLLSIGLVALGQAQIVASRQNGWGRRITTATALARDLISQIGQWDFDDPRLANADETNDTPDAIADGSGHLERSGTQSYDHHHEELGTGYRGVPNGAVRTPGGGYRYERYWNVMPLDVDGNRGTNDAILVAAIVRWREGGSWRRVVLTTAKFNPRLTRMVVSDL